MGTLIKVDFAHSNTSSDNGICDLTRKVITRSVSPDVIRVPTEKVELNSFQDHTSEHIKNINSSFNFTTCINNHFCTIT